MTSPLWEVYLEDNRPRFIEALFEFLRIPSISALPEHAEDVQRAGQWVADRLQGAGAENVQIMPTGGHPVVYGEWLHAPGKPTVLIYGHFDTQPVDPLELWKHPPFDPVLKGGRIYARGASDDKGNLFSAIVAVEALLKTEESLPVNVKFFFEGQEEIGSPQLAKLLAENRDHFSCDMVISADGLQWAPDQPSLELGLKGLCALQIDVKGPSGDLHSGMCGGVIQNPIHALARIIDSMRSSEGHILVEGFYDDVVELTEEDRHFMAQVPYNESEYMATMGVNALFGEPGYTTRERNWARPALEVNGIWGGFQGEGDKTVIPAEAHAKITCRLVSDQQPATVAAAVATHVKKVTPPGVQVVIQQSDHGAYPYLMPMEHPGNVAAFSVLKKLYGKDPYYTRSGGSIPVCHYFLKELGAYTVGLAFSLDDEHLHAPNEFLRLESLNRGQKGFVMLLKELARKGC